MRLHWKMHELLEKGIRNIGGMTSLSGGGASELPPKRTTNTGRLKIAALKFVHRLRARRSAPKKAPTTNGSVSSLSQLGQDWPPGTENQETYYQDGWRLLSTTAIVGVQLNAITNDQAERLNVPGEAGNINCALRTLRRLLHKAEEWKLVRRAQDELSRKQGRICSWMKRRRKSSWLAPPLANGGDANGSCSATSLSSYVTPGCATRRSCTAPRRKYGFGSRSDFYPDSKTPSGIRDVPISDRAIEVLKRRCGERHAGLGIRLEEAIEVGHLTTLAKKFGRRANRRVCQKLWCCIVAGTTLEPAL